MDETHLPAARLSLPGFQIDLERADCLHRRALTSNCVPDHSRCSAFSWKTPAVSFARMRSWMRSGTTQPSPKTRSPSALPTFAMLCETKTDVLYGRCRAVVIRSSRL